MKVDFEHVGKYDLKIAAGKVTEHFHMHTHTHTHTHTEG